MITTSYEVLAAIRSFKIYLPPSILKKQAIHSHGQAIDFARTGPGNGDSMTGFAKHLSVAITGQS